ncbi:efflux RND transporter permease subunit [Asaia lannensis]|uniref:CusA/CzcA family heavy metal efflux RND transporter n=1 Tax=Asaia lannensis NBRC 102526 TaxID=1307926 RepID=A0ABT1CI50_9PROT|nr:CusA/CzcA family heavy metal efflux RND transporter [Asaia lannensis]MCO6160552.1 CusA/CzcA family heavy metal efflux RND transporter [Asaia lannensis NBRC 102526]GBQ95234.1 cobalt/zinc/cadmium resistance heavy metal efflux pump protein CzcA [Asaia lannensis NBRC 102526]
MWQFLQSNRLAVLALCLLLVLGGLCVVPGLPVEPVPDISPQQVLVSVTAPGLATEEVEKQITFPLEASLTGLPDLIDLRSVSRTGVCVVYLQFDDRSDLDLDRARIAEKLQKAKETIAVPVSLSMGPLATGMGEIMQIQIKGDRRYSPLDLNRLMSWAVAPQLRLVPGVADVNVNGGAEETYTLALDPARMRAHDVSIGQIYAAVESNNASSGGGWIARQAEQNVVVGRALIGSLADFAAIPVRMAPNGVALRLRDLGTVSLGARLRLGAVTRDGKGEIVNGVVLMQKGASSNATLAAIEKALPAISQTLPPGVTLAPFYSRATLTDETVHTIKENLVLGAVLVFLTLLLVLGNWRAALVIISVIPVSLVMAFVGMRVFGISANLLSLGAIDFGMIVDGALVVVEHMLVERARTQGRVALEKLATETVQTVIRPVSFAIFVIIMVYLPVLTLQGVEGRMFRPMAQTIIMGLLTSVVYCFAVVPVLSALVLRKAPQDRETRFVHLMRGIYDPALSWCARHARIVFMTTAAVFIFALALASRLGGEFVPQLEEGALVVSATRLPSASLPTVLAGVTQEERLLMQFPEVETVVSNTGTAAIPTDPMGTNETDSFVFLKPRSRWRSGMTQARLVDAMSRTLNQGLPDAAYSFTQPIEMRMDDLLSGVRTQLAVSIYGDDLALLDKLAAKLVGTIGAVPGAADVAQQGEGKVPYLHVDINREAAARLGVGVPDILATVEAIGGHIGRPAIVDNALVPTQIRFRDTATATQARIAGLQIRREDGQGWVLLRDVARIAVDEGSARVDRDSLHRRVIVQANVRGRDVRSFVSEAQRKVGQEMVLPSGYRLEWSGQFRNLDSAMKRLAQVVPVALLMIFVFLVLALGSPRAALLVFINLPVAATGGIFALAIRGLPFSIAAGIGFIALFGVAILNGVVLVSQITAFRREGLGAADAAFAAAKARFRPVLATASVASLGFFPMAFSGSAGAEVERPLATVVIGGLITSTLLTLLVLPLLYARFFARHDKTA